jgi:hypothetical protein
MIKSNTEQKWGKTLTPQQLTELLRLLDEKKKERNK